MVDGQSDSVYVVLEEGSVDKVLQDLVMPKVTFSSCDPETTQDIFCVSSSKSATTQKDITNSIDFG